MGNKKQITILGTVYNRHVPGYSNFNIYHAKAATPFTMGGSSEFYLMTRSYYSQNSTIWMDLDAETEPLNHQGSNKINGFPVYVQYPPDTIPLGYFATQKRVSVTNPVEEFQKHSIDRSRFNLYTVDHILPNTGKKDSLSRVFSEVSYIFKDSEIPGHETIELVRNNKSPSDNYTYYLHKRDEAAYQARLWQSIKGHG